MKLEFSPGTLRPISRSQMEAARSRLPRQPRHRSIVRYHDHPERVQRMLHAIEPESYVRPHRHVEPGKTEVFLALEGEAFVCRWSAEGELEESVALRAGGPCHGVEIPPGAWHSLVSAVSGTLLYEVLEGPYDPSDHKDYAGWAPEEQSPEGARWHADLRARLGLAPA